MKGEATSNSAGKLGCRLAIFILVMLIAGVAWLIYSRPWRKPFRSSPRQQAAVMCSSFKEAILSYRKEYRRFPVTDDTASEGTIFRSNTQIVVVLLGNDGQLNPKGIGYLPEFRQVERGGKNGLVVDGSTLSLVDPWGEEFYIQLDIDGDRTIGNPDKASATRMLREDVLVYSSGPDRDPNTWTDNLVSWGQKAPAPGKAATR